MPLRGRRSNCAARLFEAAFATEHAYARVDIHRWSVTISSMNAQDSAPTLTRNKVEACPSESRPQAHQEGLASNSSSLAAIARARFRGAYWLSTFLEAGCRRVTNSLISLACGCPLSVPSNLSTMSLALCMFYLNYNTNLKDRQICPSGPRRQRHAGTASGHPTAAPLVPSTAASIQARAMRFTSPPPADLFPKRRPL